MNLVVLSHLEPTAYDKRYYSFNLLVTFLCKHIIMLRNKPTTIANDNCKQLNSLVCNDRLNSKWRLRHSGVIVKHLNTVWLIYVLVHFMHLMY